MSDVKIISTSPPYAALQPQQALLICHPISQPIGIREDVLGEAKKLSPVTRQVEYASSREFLLRIASDLLGEPVELSDLKRLPNGALSFGNAKFENLKFNLTHSKRSLGFAFQKLKSPGVDVESVARFSKGITPRERKWLHSSEMDWLNSHQASDEKPFRLCLLWTIKEALTKREGTGFASGFKNLNILEMADLDSKLISFSIGEDILSLAVPKDTAELHVSSPTFAIIDLHELFLI
ncbi:MAG: 4'-phosphopantetheinyl transferase superfamily protein [Pseudomonadota bacterium]